MPRHTISHAGRLFVGAGQKGQKFNGARGVPFTPVVQVDLGVPAAASANAHAASQAVNSTAAVLNGALAGVNDVPRNIVAAWTNAAILTVTGRDENGDLVVEASASGTSFAGKKAFKSITSAVFNANVTGATIGTGTVLGLPYRCAGKVEMFSFKADATEELATATVVAADATVPATATTGDVRGTVSPASAPNGALRFRAFYKIADLDSQAGCYGVQQFAG